MVWTCGGNKGHAILRLKKATQRKDEKWCWNKLSIEVLLLPNALKILCN